MVQRGGKVAAYRLHARTCSAVCGAGAIVRRTVQAVLTCRLRVQPSVPRGAAVPERP